MLVPRRPPADASPRWRQKRAKQWEAGAPVGLTPVTLSNPGTSR